VTTGEPGNTSSTGNSTSPPNSQPAGGGIGVERAASLPVHLGDKHLTAEKSLYAYASAGGWEFGGEVEFPVKKYSGATVVNQDSHPERRRRLQAPGAGRHHQGRGAAHRPRCGRKQAEYGNAHHPAIGAPLTWAGSVIGEERMMVWLIQESRSWSTSFLEKVSEVPHQGGRVLRQGVRSRKADGLPRSRHRIQRPLSLPKQFENFVLRICRRSTPGPIESGIGKLLHPTSAGNKNKNLKFWPAGARHQADGDEFRT